MRSFFIFLVINFFFLSNFTSAKSAENRKIKLSSKAIKSFYSYISSNRKPSDRFLITTDGVGTFVWYCPQTLCFPSSEKIYAKPCSKYNNNKPCKIFAVGRKIKWKNLSNVQTTIMKFKQSDSLTEVKKKLKKIGFLD